MLYTGTILPLLVLYRFVYLTPVTDSGSRRSRSPCGLRRRSEAAWLLGSRVRIPLRLDCDGCVLVQRLGSLGPSLVVAAQKYRRANGICTYRMDYY